MALVAGCFSLPAHATTLIVPDQAPTIQAGLDAGVDTVLIRPGDYAETAVVSEPGILVMGMSADGTDLPTIAGLRIEIYASSIYPALYAFQGLRFVGHVVYLNNRNNADISFAECHLRDGMADSSGFGDTADITFYKCRLEGFLDLIAKNRIGLDSCYMTGHLSVSPGSVEVHGCTFQGEGDNRSYSAIRSDGHSGCHIVGNTIRGYAEGISLSGDDAVVTNNVVEDCTYLGVDVGHANIIVSDNTIRRCGYGIHTESQGIVSVSRNAITDIGGFGIEVGSDTEVVGNVIWGCGGDGVRVSNYVRVRQNTSCLNGGSGYVSGVDPYQPGQEWIGNIGYGNGRYGANWLTWDVATIACNDWFGNRLGDVEGRPPSTADFFVDPQFCNADSADVRLDSASPLLADTATCGQIGALGVGCGVTPTLVQRFTAGRVGDGVRVIWEVAPGAAASAILVERAEGLNGQAWTQPVMERSSDGRAVVELDRSALPDHTYRYRLVAMDGGELVVLDPGILVEAQAPLAFALAAVGPSPGGGPVRIAFTLPHAAEIEIDVYDVQGRRVASPARGEWPAGSQVVQWDGRARDGQQAPAGLYLVRYRYPGGQDRRGIVRVR
jgi:hypothetical protein